MFNFMNRPVPEPVKVPAPLTPLEDIFAGLEMYGRVFVHHHNDGEWSCTCTLKTNSTLAKVEVRAADKHKTMRAAAEACLAKCVQVVASMEFTPRKETK